MINNTVEEVRKHVQAISDLLGIKKDENTEDTPLRVAKMLCLDVFRNRNDAHLQELRDQMKTFPAESDVAIGVENVPFNSMCMHHWMPFFGKVNVYYVPRDRIIGLSKIPRIVDYFSKRPQLQERLTADIGEFLVGLLNPVELRVVVEAEHTCVMCRGIEKPCNTVTEWEYGD
jgi:GTP cyclohydrolase I